MCSPGRVSLAFVFEDKIIVKRLIVYRHETTTQAKPSSGQDIL